MRTRSSLFALWLACAPLLVPASAASQRPTRSDTTQVADSLRPLPLPPLIVTGTRLPVRRDRMPFAADALTATELIHEPSMYAAQALERLPSASLEEGAGVGGPTILRLRGGDEPFTQVMFDGVPINLTGGFIDLQGLTLVNVERVEVSRGPHSAMYGSSAMAGAVQFVTRRGRPGPPHVVAALEGGTSVDADGQARGELSMDGGSARLRYSAGVGTSYFRGIYALPHDLRTWDASLRLDAALASTLFLESTLRFMDISSNLPVRDAGVTRAPLDPNQEDGRERWLGSVVVRATPSAGQRHSLSLRLLRDDFSYQDSADGLDPADYPFFVFDFDFGLQSVLDRGTAEYVGEVDFGAGRNDLTLAFGAKVEREDLTVAQTGAFGDSDQAFDRDNAATFAEIQGRVGERVDFLGGVRLEKFEGLTAEVLPRVGVLVALEPDVLKLRAAVGRAFKAPNLQQQYLENPFTVPNPDLAPELSVGWELGLIATAPSGDLTARATLFRQGYSNLIRLVPVGSGGVQQNTNLGESRVLGVETEVAKALGSAWRASLGATWLDSELLENAGLSADLYPNGSRFLGLPRWTGNAVLEGPVTNRLSATVRGRLVGRQEVFTERFSGQRVTVDSHVLVGATLRAELRETAQAYARVDNLFDARYATAYDRPGVPLTLVLGVRITN